MKNEAHCSKDMSSSTTRAAPDGESLFPETHAEPWARSVRDVVDGFAVDPERGLPEAEAAERLARVGPNLLRRIRRRSLWSILSAQVRSLLVALLAAAGIAALVFQEWAEAVAILAVLLINTLIGFVTELKATRSMEALRNLGTARARVRRDGELRDLPAEALVPGDIVIFEAGDVVVADLRLLDASKVQANESTLTGESLPTSKGVSPMPRDAPLSDRKSMLFKGTVVTRGSGAGLVVATGMHSELGQIARLVEDAKDETTPLEKRLERLGRRLIWATLLVACLVTAAGFWTGKPVLLIVETAIALLVATVPEGLPIIATIALARGMHRMAREHALVNRLSVVETLGTTSVLCIDKTGTLTDNRLRAHRWRLPSEDDAARRRAFEVGALCNNAELRAESAGVGDPLEVALLVAAREHGIERSALLADFPERQELAFDPELKLMATVHGDSAPFRVAVKGAPEAVLRHTTLDERSRQRWLAESEALATDGLRVLALADRELERLDDEVYAGLTFVGLVAFLDPPRKGVSATLFDLRRAGLELVLATGDHPGTARKIALMTELVTDEHTPIVVGDELERALEGGDCERNRLREVSLFARVSPKQKLQLIELHREAGSIVAMTGDGVNDAPALRTADIGIAMGLQGTEAAKQAADMVLKDDDLSTLALAIREGRVIVDNLRNFIVYLLSCNLGEVLIVTVAAVVGAPLPLLPLQILFLNLVTDVFPALALGVGEAEGDVMSRPPRPSSEALLTRHHAWAIIGYGASMAASVLGAFALAWNALSLDATGSVTVSFLTLALAQVWHVFNLRAPGSSLWHNAITTNRWVWGALLLCVALVLMATYIPLLAHVLVLGPPPAIAWLCIITMSLLPLLIGQIAIEMRGRARGRPCCN